ncbi:MAG: PAS domain S-box protein [Methanospirillaceae archaeon]|nr:PAS domain S-box protein [Methanospirillaceae archaeon]
MIRVLFVDDNIELCSVFQLYLEDTKEFIVTTCYCAADALQNLGKYQYDVIVSDYNMPGMTGIDLLEQIKKDKNPIPFILFTGDDTKETAIAALNAGADFYQEKVDDIEIQILDLSNKIRMLYAKNKAEEANLRKDAILECISYAADHFLRGYLWEEEIEEILSRFGETLQIQRAYIIRVAGSDTVKYPELVVQCVWEEERCAVRNPLHEEPIRSYLLENDWVYEKLKRGEPVIGTMYSDEDTRSFLYKTGISSLLLAPIISGTVLWGFIGLENYHHEHVWSDEEVKAIHLATGVFGSAKYRIEIEEMFRNPIQHGLVGIFVTQNNHFLYTNPRMSQIFAYAREEMLRSLPFMLFHPDDRDLFISSCSTLLLSTFSTDHLELRGISANGSVLYCELFLSQIILSGRPAVICTLLDISARKFAEQRLLESESKFREIFHNSNDMIFLHAISNDNEPGAILEVNQVALDTLGYSRDLLVQMRWDEICPDFVDYVQKKHLTDSQDMSRNTFETEFRTSSGLVPVEVNSHRFTFQGNPVMLSVARNITERKVAEVRLRQSEETLKQNILTSLYEKDTLLREIHHRVKNNMQIITSILTLQDYRVNDEKIHEIIRDCRNRISSMAIIHEKLYMTESFSEILLGDYLQELTDRIVHEFYPVGDVTACIITCDPNLCVDIERAIPLGLISNELITNSMKYAFPDRESGTITIVVEQKESVISVRFSDDGVGLPPGYESDQKKTLGMQLIENLVFQLQGTITTVSDSGGTRYSLEFPIPQKKR